MTLPPNAQAHVPPAPGPGPDRRRLDAALSEGRWTDALLDLAAAEARRPLGSDDLESYGEALWWSGPDVDALEQAERVDRVDQVAALGRSVLPLALARPDAPVRRVGALHGVEERRDLIPGAHDDVALAPPDHEHGVRLRDRADVGQRAARAIRLRLLDRRAGDHGQGLRDRREHGRPGGPALAR